MFSSSELIPNTQFELVFLDQSVNGYEGLLTEIENSSHRSIITVSLEEDAIAQITDTLRQYQENSISGIHIISHGQEGNIQLGNINLSRDNLSNYTDELTAWGESLTENGDILFYGCNVAQGQIGKEFVHNLSKITQADIVASDDLTGNENLNGDWILEYNTGNIETETLTFNSFNDTLALNLATIQAAAGNLANLDLADFIDLIGNFTGNGDNTVFTGTGISGFIGKGLNTPSNSDDIGLNISNATITLTKQEGVDNYTYSITGANVDLIGVDFVDLQGTFSLNGGIVDNSVTSITLDSSNTTLFAGSGTDTTNTDDDKGVRITNGTTKIQVSDNGVAYEVSGISSLVGLDGVN